MDLTLIVRLWAPKTKEDSAKSCPRAELKAFFPPLTELLDSKTYNPKIPWIKVMEAMCGQNLSFFSQEGLKSAYGKKDFFLCWSFQTSLVHYQTLGQNGQHKEG